MNHPVLRPSEINWGCIRGIQYAYHHHSAEALVTSGLVLPHEIPANRARRSEGIGIHIAKDGTYIARLDADLAMRRDAGFKRFLGDLLSDQRLSLVKGEPRHV